MRLRAFALALSHFSGSRFLAVPSDIRLEAGHMPGNFLITSALAIPLLLHFSRLRPWTSHRLAPASITCRSSWPIMIAAAAHACSPSQAAEQTCQCPGSLGLDRLEWSQGHHAPRGSSGKLIRLNGHRLKLRRMAAHAACPRQSGHPCPGPEACPGQPSPCK